MRPVRARFARTPALTLAVLARTMQRSCSAATGVHRPSARSCTLEAAVDHLPDSGRHDRVVGRRRGSARRRRARRRDGERRWDHAGRRDPRRHQAVRGRHRRRPDAPVDRARRVLLPPRAVGLRQDDDPPDDRRLRAADRGRDLPRRQADRRRAAVSPQRQHGLPALRPVPAHGRRPERRLRPAPAQGRARTKRRGASARRSRSSAWRATSTGGPGRCPAASSSASRWPGRWSTARPCCSSTSRWAPST